MSADDSVTVAIPFSTPISTIRKRGSKETEDEDSIVILNALLDFKAQHGGSHPTPTTIAPLLDAVQGSLHHQLTADQLYNRLRTLKHKYYRAVNAGGPGPTQFDRTFFDLAVKAWGEKSADVEEKKPKVEVVQNGNGVAHDHHDEDEIMNEDEDEDRDLEEEEDSDEDEEEEEEDDDDDDVDEDFDSICETYKYLARAMKDVWEKEGHSLGTLKSGMKNMDKEKAKQLDNKWKQHFMKELEIKKLHFESQHELAGALAASYMDNES